MFANTILPAIMNKKGYFVFASAFYQRPSFYFACNNSKQPPAHDIVSSPEELSKKAKYNIQELLDYAKENKGHIGDSFVLQNDSVVRTFTKRTIILFSGATRSNGSLMAIHCLI